MVPRPPPSQHITNQNGETAETHCGGAPLFQSLLRTHHRVLSYGYGLRLLALLLLALLEPLLGCCSGLPLPCCVCCCSGLPLPCCVCCCSGLPPPCCVCCCSGLPLPCCCCCTCCGVPWCTAPGCFGDCGLLRGRCGWPDEVLPPADPCAAQHVCRCLISRAVRAAATCPRLQATRSDRETHDACVDDY
jgi:hypothetical protein